MKRYRPLKIHALFLHAVTISLFARSYGQDLLMFPSIEPSPESFLTASEEPTLEPDSEWISSVIGELVKDSYWRNVDFIRQGIPAGIVSSFYDFALHQLADSQCLLFSHSGVSDDCVANLFNSSDGYAANSLLSLVSKDKNRIGSERLFPDLVALGHLPPPTSEQQAIVEETKTKTLNAVDEGWAKNWSISTFPADEDIRHDPEQELACAERDEMMQSSSFTMSASSLTATVFGIAQQIIFVHGETPQARMILDRHLKVVYTAVRCERLHGDDLTLPTSALQDYIRRAHLALISTRIGGDSSHAILPRFEQLKDLVAGSRHFLSEEIERFTSIDSLGSLEYLSWTGDDVSSEKLDARMNRKVSLEQYTDYFKNKPPSNVTGPCLESFGVEGRIDKTQDVGESCCASSCIIGSGRELDVSIVNEMCCNACNEYSCDLNALAKVIEIQAFRFSGTQRD